MKSFILAALLGSVTYGQQDIKTSNQVELFGENPATVTRPVYTPTTTVTRPGGTSEWKKIDVTSAEGKTLYT